MPENYFMGEQFKFFCFTRETNKIFIFFLTFVIFAHSTYLFLLSQTNANPTTNNDQDIEYEDDDEEFDHNQDDGYEGGECDDGGTSAGNSVGAEDNFEEANLADALAEEEVEDDYDSSDGGSDDDEDGDNEDGEGDGADMGGGQEGGMCDDGPGHDYHCGQIHPGEMGYIHLNTNEAGPYTNFQDFNNQQFGNFDVEDFYYNTQVQPRNSILIDNPITENHRYQYEISKINPQNKEQELVCLENNSKNYTSNCPFFSIVGMSKNNPDDKAFWTNISKFNNFERPFDIHNKQVSLPGYSYSLLNDSLSHDEDDDTNAILRPNTNICIKDHSGTDTDSSSGKYDTRNNDFTKLSTLPEEEALPPSAKQNDSENDDIDLSAIQTISTSAVLLYKNEKVFIPEDIIETITTSAKLISSEETFQRDRVRFEEFHPPKSEAPRLISDTYLPRAQAVHSQQPNRPNLLPCTDNYCRTSRQIGQTDGPSFQKMPTNHNNSESEDEADKQSLLLKFCIGCFGTLSQEDKSSDEEDGSDGDSDNDLDDNDNDNDDKSDHDECEDLGDYDDSDDGSGDDEDDDDVEDQLAEHEMMELAQEMAEIAEDEDDDQKNYMNNLEDFFDGQYNEMDKEQMNQMTFVQDLEQCDGGPNLFEENEANEEAEQVELAIYMEYDREVQEQANEKFDKIDRGDACACSEADGGSKPSGEHCSSISILSGTDTTAPSTFLATPNIGDNGTHPLNTIPESDLTNDETCQMFENLQLDANGNIEVEFDLSFEGITTIPDDADVNDFLGVSGNEGDGGVVEPIDAILDEEDMDNMHQDDYELEAYTNADNLEESYGDDSYGDESNGLGLSFELFIDASEKSNYRASIKKTIPFSWGHLRIQRQLRLPVTSNP